MSLGKILRLLGVALGDGCLLLWLSEAMAAHLAWGARKLNKASE